MELKKIMAALSAIEEKKKRQEQKIQTAKTKLAELEKEEMEWKRRIIVGEVEKIKMEIGDTESLIAVLQDSADERTQKIIQKQSEALDTDASTEENELPTHNSGGTGIVKITIRVTEHEKNCIERNVCQTLCRSLNDYARKMLVDGYVIAWDMAELDELLKEISYTNRSLNQIAKRINLLGSVYQGDMIDILHDWQSIRMNLLSSIAELKKICFIQQPQTPVQKKNFEEDNEKWHM